MTNDDTMLREVDQALAEDETAETIQKNLPAVIGAALIVVAGVGGWQFWNHRHDKNAAVQSAAYSQAVVMSGTDEGTAALEAIAAKKGGYAAIARMRLAAEKAAAGETGAAIDLYRKVYEEGGASKRLKDAARLHAAYLSVDEGRDAVLKDIGELDTDETQIGFYAREIVALAAFKAEDYQAAEEMFLRAAASPNAPEPVRSRAGEFAALAAAGKAGVEFPTFERDTRSDAERYLEGLEEAGGDLSSILGTDDGADAHSDESADDAAAPESEPAAEAPADPQAQEGNE
ncbi:MAG: tetratricopeptide repeat protein [Parvularculaceae bacterium]|nr:tetratricopeptide repeat protein [Parvularculaceae bacterium]